MAEEVDRMTLDVLTGQIAESTLARDFLYDDPESFRAGVEETLRAVRHFIEKQEKVTRTS